MRLACVGALAAVLLVAAGGRASADCKVRRFAELPVTMSGTRPLVPVKLNGREVRLMADSGAFFSTLNQATADELKLPQRMGPFGAYVKGVSGETQMMLTTVRSFTLVGVELPNVDFVVAPGAGDVDSAGVLGQNILGLGDVEYDLANGAIRLFKPQGCGRMDMAYWAKPDQTSIIDQPYDDGRYKKTLGYAYLNGQKIRVLFDSGSWRSLLSLRAAARAGITPRTPGVVDAGSSVGIGSHALRNWIAPVASFKIGDEEIKNTRMLFGDLDFDGIDMLLGADFFLSHRIYVSNDQKKIFFTYNGGTVFNLSVQTSVLGSSLKPEPALSAAGDAAPATPTLPEISGAPPTDAEGFSRRGAAFAARRDYEHALADLTRACDLAPTEPKYFLQRARLRLETHQPAMALNDLNQTLKLAPDTVAALTLRAIIREGGGDMSGAVADLDAASRRVAKQDDVHFQLAPLYQAADELEPAIHEYDMWIATHDGEARMGAALAGRCRARALEGRDLDKALGDCNRVGRGPQTGAIVFDSRALVYLRMGQYDRAISEYNEALTRNPKLAVSLYGRGLAKLKKGMNAEGEADLAAAVALQPKIADTMKTYGLAPGG